MLIAGIKLFLNPVFVHLHKDAVECHLIKSCFQCYKWSFRLCKAWKATSI